MSPDIFLKAVEKLEEAGFKVTAILTVVDAEEPPLRGLDPRHRGLLDHGPQVGGHHEHRPPHAEHPDQHPPLVQRLGDGRRGNGVGPGPDGEEDRCRIGRVQRHDARCGLDRVLRTGGGAQRLPEA